MHPQRHSEGYLEENGEIIAPKSSRHIKIQSRSVVAVYIPYSSDSQPS